MNRQKSVGLYTNKIVTLFNQSYQSYGTRRIRFDLQKENIWVSRRYIARLMKASLLVSKYPLNLINLTIRQ
ncbi:MAG: transposase [Gilliamella sp.]|nr:transposase [Gilliamella sp.]